MEDQDLIELGHAPVTVRPLSLKMHPHLRTRYPSPGSKFVLETVFSIQSTMSLACRTSIREVTIITFVGSSPCSGSPWSSWSSPPFSGILRIRGTRYGYGCGVCSRPMSGPWVSVTWPWLPAVGCFCCSRRCSEVADGSGGDGAEWSYRVYLKLDG